MTTLQSEKEATMQLGLVLSTVMRGRSLEKNQKSLVMTKEVISFSLFAQSFIE